MMAAMEVEGGSHRLGALLRGSPMTRVVVDWNFAGVPISMETPVQLFC